MRVLITGCASGLGKELVKGFLAEKWDVVGIDRDEDGLTILHNETEGAVDLRHCDVSDEYDVLSLSNSMNNLDVLINCAGVNKIMPLEDLDEESWDDTINTNAKGIYVMSKSFVHHLKASKGTIVNVVSNASRIPMTHSLAYNASKGAAEIMTRQLARELTKGKGITVFGINPNKLEGTKMSRYIEHEVLELRGWTEEEAKRYQLNALVPGFETKPEWIAELLVWLLVKKHRHQYLSGCLLDLGA